MNVLLKTTTAIVIAAGLLVSCNKSDFLNKKPNTGIVIPSTLAELRAMLDNTSVFTWSPGLGEISADNYYITYTNWQAQIEMVRNAYTWEKDMLGNTRSLDDWSVSYQQILYANIVLQQLELLTPSSSELNEWNDIKGAAYFLRAFANFNLVAHFAVAYDSLTANTDMGIPLRDQADIHQLAQRSTVKESFAKVLEDLNASIPLLSNNVPVPRNRPGKPASYAMLSRIFLYMRKYSDGKKYADSCLNLYSKLINYNTLNTTATTPFERGNDENIYYSQCTNYSILQGISTVAFIDTSLYQSYAANDLRKVIFFRTISGTNMGIKRGYSGAITAFSGPAVDEVYLNRAECLARTGDITGAMNDLNTVLSKRWKTGTYTNITAANQTDALQKIQTERRKELVFRGLRWLDLKRYYKEGAVIVINRILNGTAYTLAGNSPLYVFPIPADEITLSGITQNPR